MTHKKISSINLAGLFSVLIVILSLNGCASTKVDNVSRGADFQFRPGYPELRAVASGYLDENDNSIISIAAEVVYGSLVYTKTDGDFVASAQIEVQIANKDSLNSPTRTEHINIDISEQNPNIRYSQDTELIQKEYEVEPGTFLVDIIITDAKSQKSSYRSEEVYIPSPTQKVSNITNIQLLTKLDAKKDSVFIPQTTYDIPSSVDSLKFSFQITNNKPDSPITINAKLLKFNADTTVAWPMTFSNHYSSSIQYKGIEYDRFEVVNSTRRVLTDPGSVLIELVFPGLAKGNYRLEVESEETGDDDSQIYRARDFSVKTPNYPSLKTPKELAEPLIYLMSEKEHKKLMSIQSQDSLKKAIDKFWLSNIKNSKTAGSVISLYYERVEEANKQFSNFKEGWKTDLGMIYILFGPPWYVDKSLDMMRWSYSYNTSDPELNFFFKTPKIKNKYFPFDNYLLSRDNMYYNIQYQQIQMWLSGLILNRL